jgi:hypothetical protein
LINLLHQPCPILYALRRYTCAMHARLAELADTVLLAIRACAPHLREIKMSPPLNDKARFGLVTLANKAQAIYLPEIRQLMLSAFQ